jgi:integrase
MLAAARDTDWRFEVALVLAHETGHRIRSIRRLRWSDVEARDGWIRWRQENDKVEWEHGTPLTPEALAALRRAEEHRVSLQDGWVFPSPADPGLPCSRNIMRDWWNAVQKAAGLETLPRLGWHSLRRKFANDLRHVPLKDLATLGGWKDTQTLLKCYLKEDEAAMVEALQSRRGRSAFGDEQRNDAAGKAAGRASDLRMPEPEE